nr:MAG TPA: hypothetical protein [Caudoviricetes sp.]
MYGRLVYNILMVQPSLTEVCFTRTLYHTLIL